MNFDTIFAKRAFVEGKERANVKISVANGKITNIELLQNDEYHQQSSQSSSSATQLVVPAECVLLPGLVDSHVHVNDPGRNEWETFTGATQAAISGGICTIADMPLNSIPSTTSKDNLQVKIKATTNQLWADVGFIGGVVSGNENDIEDLFSAGVRGFKCFLIHSGVDEFKHVSADEALQALQKMANWKFPRKPFLMYHAEVEDPSVPDPNANEDPKKYDTYLKTRPPVMENKAIELVIKLCEQTGVASHIVHLSSYEALESIRRAKQKQLPLTVETCFHYLAITSNQVPDSNTKFKCCPPIRNSQNCDALWKGLEEGLIDMVVSDHSPCTADLKERGGGNFLEAWGGISSLSLGLPILWTEMHARQISEKWQKAMKWLAEQPAKLLALDRQKGKIEKGFDADFCIFHPDEEWTVEASKLYFHNKHSPYEGRKLRGRVHATVLRGALVYDLNKGYLSKSPLGQTLLN